MDSFLSIELILWNGRNCLAQNSQEHVECAHINHKLFVSKMADESWVQNVSAKGSSYPNLVWFGRELLNSSWAFILWSLEIGFYFVFSRTGHKNVLHRHGMIPCGAQFHHFLWFEMPSWILPAVSVIIKLSLIYIENLRTEINISSPVPVTLPTWLIISPSPWLIE